MDILGLFSIPQCEQTKTTELTIADCRLREFNRKMTEKQKDLYKKETDLYSHAVNRQKTDKDKIYGLHKPFTKCIAKGKPDKPYEFGNKE